MYGMRLKNNIDNRKRAADIGFDMWKGGGTRDTAAGEAEAQVEPTAAEAPGSAANGAQLR